MNSFRRSQQHAIIDSDFRKPAGYVAHETGIDLSQLQIADYQPRLFPVYESKHGRMHILIPIDFIHALRGIVCTSSRVLKAMCQGLRCCVRCRVEYPLVMSKFPFCRSDMTNMHAWTRAIFRPALWRFIE